MRDYTNIERYINELTGDVYPQPPDEGHTRMARWLIDNWFVNLPTCKTVLDVGCGSGFMQPMFAELGIVWTGVTLSADYLVCKNQGLDVHNEDMSFLPFADKSYDVVLGRHVLEHSPMPILTLMEWNRVAKQWVCVVLPNPDHYGYVGRNHYSVMSHTQLVWLAARAGMKPIWELLAENEIRVLLEKSEKRIE